MMETGDLAEYLKEFNRDLTSFRKDVEIVREWVRAQAHLPEIMDDKKIESLLLINKCSIEKTKRKIDAYYTLRSLNPLVREFDMQSEAFQVAQRFGYQLVLPKLVHGKHRIMIQKVRDPSLMDSVPVDMLMCILYANMEIRCMEDNTFNDFIIVDLTGCSKSFLARCLVHFPTFLQIYKSVYSSCFKAVYVLGNNNNPFLNSFVTTVKTLHSAKVLDKVIFCDVERVLQDIPRDYLPRDFHDCGGNGPTLEELWIEMNQLYKKHESFLSQRNKYLVNESLRVELINSESMGFYGNFKKIDVD